MLSKPNELFSLYLFSNDAQLSLSNYFNTHGVSVLLIVNSLCFLASKDKSIGNFISKENYFIKYNINSKNCVLYLYYSFYDRFEIVDIKINCK